MPTQFRKDTVLTGEYVRSMLDYDPATGVLSWKKKAGNARLAGKRAGCLHWKGYRQLDLLGKKRPAALVAWLHAGGEMPPYCIDHKNGVRDDDRLENLRPATEVQNSTNKRCLSRSGLKGAHLDRGKYSSEITARGKRIKLGRFDTAGEAHAAYAAASARLHGEFSRVA